MECLSIKVSVVYMNIYLSKQLKEELAWAIDIRLRVISNEMLFETVLVLPLTN